MTQERYAEEILPIVARCQKMLELEGKSFIFQEDNDGSHGTRSYKNFCVETKDWYKLIDIDDWPANSPDLKPNENFWRILKSRVKLHKAMNAKELRKAIEVKWNRIEKWEISERTLDSK